MEGLQRSDVSFRRQGSSGLVWDDKFLAGLQQLAKEQKEESSKQAQSESNKDDSAAAVAAVGKSPPPVAGLTIERSRSNGGRGFRTGKVSPAIEPPSPRVSACGFCGAFGKKNSNKTRRRPLKSGKRVV